MQSNYLECRYYHKNGTRHKRTTKIIQKRCCRRGSDDYRTQSKKPWLAFIDTLAGNWSKHSIFVFANRKKYRYYQAEHYQKETSLVDVVSGCFFLINGHVLKEIGYFDENVFLYYEENILASKLKKVKKKTVIANHIEVIHNHSVSIDKSLRKYKKTKALKKSQEYFTKEYLDASFLQRAILFLVNRLSLGIRFILQK